MIAEYTQEGAEVMGEKKKKKKKKKKDSHWCRNMIYYSTRFIYEQEQA